MTFKLKTKKELTKRDKEVRAFQAQESAPIKPWEKKNIIMIMELRGGQWAEARLAGRASWKGIWMFGFYSKEIGIPTLIPVS